MLKQKIKISLLAFLLLTGLLPAQSQVDTNINSLFDSIQMMNSLLLVSVFEGDEINMAYAIKNGADINCRTEDGITPLMYASQNGFTDIVNILVFNGANINLKPRNGIGALISSVQYGYSDICEFLINKGANVNISDKLGKTALIYATAFNYPDLVSLLLNKGANPNLKSSDSINALMIATYSGYLDISKSLIDKGADINSTDESGFTPLMYAVQNGFTEIVKLLVEKGADVNHYNYFQTTPLMLATENGRTDIIEYLLSKGANPKMKNIRFEDVLKISIMTNNHEITNILKKKGVKSSKFPYYNKLFIGYGAHFNLNDFIFSGLIGLNDLRFNSDIFAGFDCRYWGKRILREINDTLSQQLWEKRYSLVAGINKMLPLKTNNGKESGILFGLKAYYTYGKYHGMNEKIDNRMMAVPQIGVYTRKNNLCLKLNYEYEAFKLYKVSPHQLNVSVSYSFTLKKYRYQSKAIVWL